MKKLLAIAVFCFAATCAVWAEGGEEAKPAPVNPFHGPQEREEIFEFAERPAVGVEGTGANRKWVITFASKAACDATVAIFDKNGKIIRHLASGVLGKNAPHPFQQDSLAQKIVWDGKDDDGKLVAADGLQVRVSLGLRPVFRRMLCEEPQGLDSRGPLGLAVDREGLLYVLEGDAYVLEKAGLPASAGALQKLNIKVFDGDGNYVRSLVPFRGDWPPEKVSVVQFMTTRDGRTIPLALSGGNFSYGGFLPGAVETVRSTPVITRDGRMIYPCGRAVEGKRRLLVIGTDGTAKKEAFAGPPLQADARACTPIFMALSPDDKHLYFAGAKSKRGKGWAACHAVYRTTLDSQDFATPFIGKEFEAGKDEGQFNDPRGLDVDAKGRLWVCDYMNDRIQVFDAAGKFLKMFPVDGPEQVRVHPKTGAVYVFSVRDRGALSRYGSQVTWEHYEDKSVIKFASFDDWKESARLDLPKRKNYMHDPGPMMALDATREQPVLWVAHFGPGDPLDFLWKVIDRGEKLEKVEHKMVRYARHDSGPPAMAADRRNNELVLGGRLLNPATGEMRELKLEGEAGRAALSGLSGIAVGPDSTIYYRSGFSLPNVEKIWRIRRFNRDGKLAPFSKAGEFLEANANRAHTAFNYQASAFAVGPDAKIYIVSAASRADDNRDVFVDVYGPDGALLRPKLIAMTKSGGCFRIDRAGRIYAADTVRPRGVLLPAWYTSDPLNIMARWYGTVFRYDPEALWKAETPGGLAAGSPVDADYEAGGMATTLKPVKMKDVLWGFYGLSPMPLQTGCQCVTQHTAFDADDWGRVWVPDAPGFCVAALDPAGNLITRFGSYGNRDATGEGGAVPKPPIPLWYPHQTAALDYDVFVRDQLARRVVQVGLTYAAEETAWVP